MDESQNEEQHEAGLRMENEFKKIKLSLEHGMDFSQSFTSPELPPEIEGRFLDSIQTFEDQYAKRKMTTVYEMMGKPSLRLASEIPDEEISASLDEVVKLLTASSISIETLCEVEERELYRFITEELINETIEDIRIDGMVRSFIYEDFYPNHPYDIKNRCTELLEYIADMGSMIPWGLADHISIKDQTYSKDVFEENVRRFRTLFAELTLLEFEYLSITLNEAKDEAIVIASVHYAGKTEGTQTVTLKGNCTFNLKCTYEWWLIHQFEVPWNMV